MKKIDESKEYDTEAESDKKQKKKDRKRKMKTKNIKKQRILEISNCQGLF